MKDDKSIVAGLNAKLANSDQTLTVDEKGCTACLHDVPEVLCDDVVFNCQVTWVWSTCTVEL